jgi:UV DNA damage endonuclease
MNSRRKIILDDESSALTIADMKAIKGKISLGLCCINNSLRGTNKKNEIFCSRSMPRRTFTVERAKDHALKNIADISKLIEWNTANKIDHLRLSSDLFPHFTDKETDPYTMDFAVKALQEAGECAKKHKHRITMHPGQFNQVGAKDESVFDHTVNDLRMHANILDHMDVGPEGILCVHGGGLYGDKESAIRRWIDQFDDLPRCVRNRLAIENCEKCYSVRNCLEIAQACKIPMIYDCHHYYCYNQLHPTEKTEDINDMMDEIVETWKHADPCFHVSEQAPGLRVGAHSDYVECIPDHMLTVPLKYNVKLNIEVEAKAKEAAIKKLKENYKYIF